MEFLTGNGNSNKASVEMYIHVITSANWIDFDLMLI